MNTESTAGSVVTSTEVKPSVSAVDVEVVTSTEVKPSVSAVDVEVVTSTEVKPSVSAVDKIDVGKLTFDYCVAHQNQVNLSVRNTVGTSAEDKPDGTAVSDINRYYVEPAAIGRMTEEESLNRLIALLEAAKLSLQYGNTGTLSDIVETALLDAERVPVNVPGHDEHFISVDTEDCFKNFRTVDEFLTVDSAYYFLGKRQNYKPYLIDLPEKLEPTKSGKLYEAFGTMAMVKYVANTMAVLTSTGTFSLFNSPIVASVAPHVHDFPNLIDSRYTYAIQCESGDFIRVVHFIRNTSMDDPDTALVCYYPNRSNLQLISKGLRNISWNTALCALLSDKMSAFSSYDRVPYFQNVWFVTGAKLKVNDKERANMEVTVDKITKMDQMQWSSRSERKYPKWDTRYIKKDNLSKLSGNELLHMKLLDMERKDALKLTDLDSYVILRRQRCDHPFTSLKRYFYCLSDSIDINAISDFDKVIFQYVAYSTIKESDLTRRTRARTHPQTMVHIRDTLIKRTIPDTNFVLKQQRVVFGNRTVSNAVRYNPELNYNPINTGRRPQIKLESLASSTFKIPGCYSLMDNTGRTPSAVEVLFFEENFKAFAASLPTATKLESYRDELSKLDNKHNRSEMKAFFKQNVLRHCDASGHVKESSGILYIDTTFEATPWYVTILYGRVNGFYNMGSDTGHHIVIAIAFHNKKTIMLHNAIQTLLEQAFNKFPNYYDRRISCLMTDGELALRSYRNLSLCEMAVHLTCDVHLHKNIVKNSMISVIPIFGSIMEVTVTDNDVLNESQPLNLVPGQKKRFLSSYLLGALNAADYKTKYQTLISSTSVDQSVIAFALKNKTALYEHSLRRKAEAGFVQQYASNNVLENANKDIKEYWKKRLTPEQAALKSLNYCSEKLRELTKALDGSSHLVYHVLTEKYRGLTTDGQTTLLRKLGLKCVELGDWGEFKLEPGFIETVSVNMLLVTSSHLNKYDFSHLRSGDIVVTNTETNQAYVVKLDISENAIIPQCTRDCQREVACLHEDPEASHNQLLLSRGILNRFTSDQKLAFHRCKKTGEKRFFRRAYRKGTRAIHGLVDISDNGDSFDSESPHPPADVDENFDSELSHTHADREYEKDNIGPLSEYMDMNDYSDTHAENVIGSTAVDAATINVSPSNCMPENTSHLTHKADFFLEASDREEEEEDDLIIQQITANNLSSRNTALHEKGSIETSSGKPIGGKKSRRKKRMSQLRFDRAPKINPPRGNKKTAGGKPKKIAAGVAKKAPAGAKKTANRKRGRPTKNNVEKNSVRDNHSSIGKGRKRSSNDNEEVLPKRNVSQR